MTLMNKFFKYQGLGNDFIIFDCRDEVPRALLPENHSTLMKTLCDRHFGIGADGVILVLPPKDGNDSRMRIFNSDGSEAEMCGNGIRCMAKYLSHCDSSLPGTSWNIETKAGVITPLLVDSSSISVNMGLPLLESRDIPTTFPIGSYGLPQDILILDGQEFQAASVGMGNPHLMIYVDDLENIPISRWGAMLECHASFPANTNVHFVQSITKTLLKALVWERGSGPTLACGTGACAILVASCLLGLSSSKADIELPGGRLKINWPNFKSPVIMTGPAELVYEGSINLNTL